MSIETDDLRVIIRHAVRRLGQKGGDIDRVFDRVVGDLNRRPEVLEYWKDRLWRQALRYQIQTFYAGERSRIAAQARTSLSPAHPGAGARRPLTETLGPGSRWAPFRLNIPGRPPLLSATIAQLEASQAAYEAEAIKYQSRRIFIGLVMLRMDPGKTVGECLNDSELDALSELAATRAKALQGERPEAFDSSRLH